MSQTIRFTAPGVEYKYTLRLSTIDERLFGVVGARVLPETGGLLQQVVWWADDERPRSVPTGALLEEARAVLREVERDSDLLFYMYAHSARMTDADGRVFITSGSGTTGGHRLAGDAVHFYSIWTGIGVCNLEKRGEDELDRGVLLEVIDRRRSKTIETENAGTVVIKRRKVKANIAQGFSGLCSFLENSGSETIGIEPGTDRSWE